MGVLARSVVVGLGCIGLFASAAAQSPPTKRYGFCMAQGVMVQGVQSKPYLTKTFETPWPITVSLESRFLTFIQSKYSPGASRPTCNTYATLADAQKYRLQTVRDEAFWTPVDWAPAAATTSPAPAPATPNAQPTVPAQASGGSAAPSQPKGAASPATTQAGVFVTCRSEFNTDLRRFYNPPVDGRGAGYPEWQASYRVFLEKAYKFKGENLSCGKYPTRAAAQADYDGWVSNARASPTVNGLASPVVITDWKY